MLVLYAVILLIFPVLTFSYLVLIQKMRKTKEQKAQNRFALLGFLVFNSYPAKVFMGDTGSLALGGFVASAAYMLQMPIFIIIVGMIYLVEVLSVMIQVTYFKKTGGKRIFKMAPFHHHLEMCGWREPKIVAFSCVLTAVLSILAYFSFYF